MKSSTLIASYLWKDTWSRWWEQPSSFFARLFVGVLLVSVATVIVVAFSLLERSIRVRLENFGLNTLVMRETMPSTDPEAQPNLDRPDRLSPLRHHGQKLRLRQLYARGQSDWQNDMLAFSYSEDDLPVLGPLLSTSTPLVILSETLPENSTIRVSLGRQVGTAVIRRPALFFRPMVTGNVLLVPQGWNPDNERLGFIETTLFERAPEAVSMQRVVDAITRFYKLDHRTLPQIQSALGLIRELENLQERQRQWRGLLAGLLGLTLALVFGAIAILEFRQNLFITALIRSFGAPSRILYLRTWIENAFIANLSAICAVCLVAALHDKIFGTLGFGRVLHTPGVNPYLSAEVASILIWVNVGAFISSLPVALGLRKPVGSVLT
jgi:hypothetical protein